MRVRLDLNNELFQEQWFVLEKEERNAVTSTCVKLSAMTWDEVYRDRGLRWELIESRTSKDGSRLYSIRVGRKMRAVARRNGDILRLLSLHPDHDSAY